MINPFAHQEIIWNNAKDLLFHLRD